MAIAGSGQGNGTDDQRRHQGHSGETEREDATEYTSADRCLACQTDKEWPGSTEAGQHETDAVEDLPGTTVIIWQVRAAPLDRGGQRR